MKYILGALLMLITTTNTVVAQNTAPSSGKLLRHVVLFKFKDSATVADITKIEMTFRALPEKIKQIAAFEWGKNNSPENLNQEFTHCFFVSFKTEKDREAYLPHPAHKAFVEILKPHLDKVLVIDYWAGK
jgi:Stress responsive A/B Barrel Domain